MSEANTVERDRLLVANRGEIACRIIAAARRIGLPVVSVFSDADAGLSHVRLADAAERIGPAPAQESYLNIDAILAAARKHTCNLIHPGYGFLAENPRFAEACAEAGLTFVGPSAEHIRLMGDKRNARAAALEAGVPVLPGSDRLAEGAEREAAADIGFPLLVKAVAGGGGHGMQRVDEPDALPAVAERLRGFAQRAYGDDGIYLERFLPRARHVEVQVFGFGDGRALHLYERDCSLQRRHQKLIEEAPAPALPADVQREMTGVAVRLAERLAYAGAGTVEFLYDPASESFYFLEMNTRIQVEHPVTEMILGEDLVTAQLRLAMGRDVGLTQGDLCVSGVAIEARLYAENPQKRFLPSPGRLERLRLPKGDGIRCDSGYREGDEITAHYDPLIAKIIAHGSTRQQAIAMLSNALKDTEVEGVRSNRDFLIALINDDAFGRADHHTRFVEESGQLAPAAKKATR